MDLRLCKSKRSRGFSLIELLCVIAIIMILASMLLGVIGKALLRVKRFAGEMDGPAYIAEVHLKLSRYAQAHPNFPQLTLNALARECNLSLRCRDFLRSREVTFIPFSGSDPDNKVVLIHLVGANHNATPVLYSKGNLCTPDPPAQ